jgi:transglutaminase-like putative cysteine protease
MNSAWVALVLADLIAVSTFARCFTGPGELTAALSSLMVVHLTALAARYGLLGYRRAWRGLGAVAAVGLPVAMVLGTTLFSPVPGHVLVHALRAGWRAFYSELAPVPELPGLVIATAWAAGAAGWLAEMLLAKRKLPPVLALIPAVGLYLFASTFGTSSWRVVGLGAMAASCCWYLAASASGREETRDRLIACPDGGVGPLSRAASSRAGAGVLSTVVIAVAAAAIIGPNLPGARSVALVAWRGGGSAGGATPTVGPGGQDEGIRISTLVQVGEEEVDDPTTTLFTVHSSVPTRELIVTLDTFGGASWTASSSVSTPLLRSFATSIRADESQPPAPTPSGPGRAKLIQVFSVAGLGGYDLPSWGNAVAVAGAGRVRQNGVAGSVVAEVPLRPGSLYAVGSTVADPSPAQLELDPSNASNPLYLQLPGSVPAPLVQLAKRLEMGAKSPYEKALALDAYLTSSKYHYRLPTRTSSGAVASSSGYGGLMSFLFQSRTGYCQQFATAFAVLARLEGLPTRIAVGFLPGIPVGHDQWQVEGVDTHAWPQVRFKRYGWIDFEPTPGATIVGSSIPGAPITTTSIAPGPVATTQPIVHNLHPSPGATATAPRSPKPGRHNGAGGAPTDPWLLVIPLAIIGWAGGVPAWRRLRLRRYLREPRTGILAAWSEVSRTLDLAGVRRQRAETFIELAKRVEVVGLLSEEAEVAFGDLARLATAARYAGTYPGHDIVDQAIRDAEIVVRSARRNVAWWQQIVAALDPRGYLG